MTKVAPGTPAKTTGFFLEVFLLWFFWQKKTQINGKGNDLATKKWNGTGTDVFEYNGVWLQSPAWKVMNVEICSWDWIFYIYLHTHIYWIFSRGSMGIPKNPSFKQGHSYWEGFRIPRFTKKGNFQPLMLVDCRLESGFDGKNSSVITDINWHCSIILRVHVSSLRVLEMEKVNAWTPHVIELHFALRLLQGWLEEGRYPCSLSIERVDSLMFPSGSGFTKY